MRLILIVFIIIFIRNEKVIASHAMGGEITYQCLGNNQYLVHFTFYRDCSGIAAPLVMDLNLTDGISGTPVTFLLNPIPGSPTQLHTVCHSDSSTCDGGPYVGIEKWEYADTISITGTSANWIIYHSENARNAALNTINNPSSNDLFLYSVINNTNGICNNSPQFSNDAVPIVCTGNQICLVNKAFDIDGDSLVYELITPRNGPQLSDTVMYLPGFSHTQPVTSNPPVSFDVTDGTICLIPSQADVSPVAILVSEFRDGELIGQIERDIQIIGMSCNNLYPYLSGINNSVSQNLDVCATLPNCFYIRSGDPDVSNITTITWDYSIPAMSAIHTYGTRDTIYFCWTPSDSDTINNPNCFSATVVDDNCPYFGTRTINFCLNVIPSQICDPLLVKSLKAEQVKIFPQPATDHINIEVNSIFEEKYRCSIYSVQGEKLIDDELLENFTTLDLVKFSTGIYYLQIISKSEIVITKKINVFR